MQKSVQIQVIAFTEVPSDEELNVVVKSKTEVRGDSEIAGLRFLFWEHRRKRNDVEISSELLRRLELTE